MTVFYELQGAHAQIQLEASALALEAFGIQATLLENNDKADLFLLSFDCADGETLPDAPTGAKVWRFKKVHK